MHFNTYKKMNATCQMAHFPKRSTDPAEFETPDIQLDTDIINTL